MLLRRPDSTDLDLFWARVEVESGSLSFTVDSCNPRNFDACGQLHEAGQRAVFQMGTDWLALSALVSGDP